jgi:hypothetical protein
VDGREKFWGVNIDGSAILKCQWGLASYVSGRGLLGGFYEHSELLASMEKGSIACDVLIFIIYWFLL